MLFSTLSDPKGFEATGKGPPNAKGDIELAGAVGTAAAPNAKPVPEPNPTEGAADMVVLISRVGLSSMLSVGTGSGVLGRLMEAGLDVGWVAGAAVAPNLKRFEEDAVWVED